MSLDSSYSNEDGVSKYSNSQSNPEYNASELQRISEKYLNGEATSSELKKAEEVSGINYRAITYGVASVKKEISTYLARFIRSRR